MRRNIGVLPGLPAGNFVVVAKAQFDRDPDLLIDTTVQCTLEVGTASDNSAVLLSSPDTATLPFSVAASLPAGGMAVLHCVGDQVFASRVKLTATQVDSLF